MASCIIACVTIVVAMNKSSRLDLMEGYTEDDFKGLSKNGRSKI